MVDAYAESLDFLFGRLNYERNQTDAAIAALNRATLADPRFSEAWTLLTYAYLRRAAAKTADDPNIYRELGYAYEVSKQYAKALTAYQKGAELAPNDTDFQQAVERVKPYAQQ